MSCAAPFFNPLGKDSQVDTFSSRRAHLNVDIVVYTTTDVVIRVFVSPSRQASRDISSIDKPLCENNEVYLQDEDMIWTGMLLNGIPPD